MSDPTPEPVPGDTVDHLREERQAKRGDASGDEAPAEEEAAAEEAPPEE